MTDVIGGNANAGDAQAVADEDVVYDQEDPRLAAEAAVAAAEAKVEKQRAHLAGAEEALEAAKAALDQGA